MKKYRVKRYKKTSSLNKVESFCVLCIIFLYKIPDSLDKYIGKVYLFDGRLGHSREYSNRIKFEEYLKERGLKALKDGITARWAAAREGLGQFRRNNFIYTKLGSWIWIDTWLVDAELEHEKVTETSAVCPENCRRCIEACPTKALSGDYSMDRGACIAQLSFNSSDLPPEDIRVKMGSWLYGCDVCQDVCPYNKNKCQQTEDFPGLEELTAYLSPEKILAMSEKELLEILQPWFSYISSDRLWLWKCNALRSMANSGDRKYIKQIKEACGDSNDKIREMALWAYERLCAHMPAESDNNSRIKA